ncbi:intestinal mucin-like protein [Chiloscyllium plagiosum]|uniref:intestinal mucin-like protein n=1 Tax=Chiloscyllium plagiosum TaxID=36176 RepID=UPI001CB7F8E4|nr:intestinal mucin-like protein [Chiloscyllium plagiosum]
MSFNGLYYNFYENCTYILVEEQNPIYNFTVLVDNYFCFPSIPFSCPKGLIIFHRGKKITISTNHNFVLRVNEKPERIPYTSDEITIEIRNLKNVRLYFNDIKTTIIAAQNYFKIIVPAKIFYNNTQGQCGSCSNSIADDCMRPNGVIEPTDCCHKTALDWKFEDPRKPYCQSAPQGVSCEPPTTTTPCTSKSICDVIPDILTENCSMVDPELFWKSCNSDHCLINSTELDCMNIQTAADICRVNGCVDWRPSAPECPFTCRAPLVYKPCEMKQDDYCEQNTLKKGLKLVTYEEGCFCPDGMKLSENKTECVSTCCLDSNGSRRNEGEKWVDPNDGCVSYTCFEYGVATRVITCSNQSDCDESQKMWDENKCCYKCVPPSVHRTCETLKRKENVTKTVNNSQCSAEIDVNKCEGNCSTSSHFNTTSNKIEHVCMCCQEKEVVEKTVDLDCGNEKTEAYTYTYIMSCDCSGNICQNEIYHNLR